MIKIFADASLRSSNLKQPEKKQGKKGHGKVLNNSVGSYFIVRGSYAFAEFDFFQENAFGVSAKTNSHAKNLYLDLINSKIFRIK